MMLLYKHTDQHIVDQIKKKNPSWVTDNGFCEKCVDFYKREMGRSAVSGTNKTAPQLINITVKGSLWRTLAGVALFALAIGTFFVLHTKNSPQQLRILLFIPFFVSMFCMIQAKEQVCAVNGLKGVKDTDEGKVLISDERFKNELKKASIRIILISAAMAGVLTAGMYFI